MNALNDLKMGMRIFRMIQEAGLPMLTVANVHEMVTENCCWVLRMMVDETLLPYLVVCISVYLSTLL